MIDSLFKKICLILYFIVLKYLPPTYYPGGKLIKRLRFLCCKRLFRSCGKNVTIESNAIIPFHKVKIGDNSGIGLNARIGYVSIGANVMMGPDVIILSRNHNYDRIDIPLICQGNAEEEPVIVEDDVWIGARVIILPGVRIGKGVIIGAGAVVTKNMPDYSIVVGNPAYVVRIRD